VILATPVEFRIIFAKASRAVVWIPLSWIQQILLTACASLSFGIDS
jgi:hypothetical protein